jgi:hypothetical protein
MSYVIGKFALLVECAALCVTSIAVAGDNKFVRQPYT